MTQTTSKLSAKEAAAAIVELINASPRSPRADEIEAIVSRVIMAPEPARHSAEAAAYIELHKGWEAMNEREPNQHIRSPEYIAYEAEWDRVGALVSAEAERIVRCSSDPMTLAAVALSYAQDTEIDFANPEPVGEREPGETIDEWAGRALAIAVLRRGLPDARVPERPPMQRSPEAEKFIELYKWWGDPSVDEFDEAELGRRHDVVAKEWRRLVRDGTDIEALAAVTISILQDTEIDFDNPAAVASEPEPGRSGAWAGHALARAVLRQRSDGAFAVRMDDNITVICAADATPIKEIRDI